MTTSIPGPSGLDVGERATLADLADLLLPSAHGMPAASEVDVQGRGLDRLLASRPDLLEPLRAVLARAVGRPQTEVLEELSAADGEEWAVLTLSVAGTYYMDPIVRELIGYPGQTGKVINDAEFVRMVSDGLLDPVLERGDIWRPDGTD